MNAVLIISQTCQACWPVRWYEQRHSGRIIASQRKDTGAAEKKNQTDECKCFHNAGFLLTPLLGGAPPLACDMKQKCNWRVHCSSQVRLKCPHSIRCPDVHLDRTDHQQIGRRYRRKYKDNHHCHHSHDEAHPARDLFFFAEPQPKIVGRGH
jgi:hypothetical protein